MSKISISSSVRVKGDDLRKDEVKTITTEDVDLLTVSRQMTEQIKKDIEESNRPKTEPSPVSDSAKTIPDEDIPVGYMRLDLPSKEYPYGKSVFARVISWTEYGHIAAAFRAQNLTALLDALDATINVPIRSLVVSDYKYLLFWHKINSFLRAPVNVSWSSVYGGRHTVQLPRVMLEDKKISITREQWKEWKEKGFTLPRVREVEFFDFISNSPDIPDADLEILDHAQWLDPDHPNIAPFIEALPEDHPYRSLQARADYLKSQSDLSILYDIEEFKSIASDYGISEYVKVKVPKFDLETAKSTLATLHQLVTVNPDLMSPARAEFVKSELDRINREGDSFIPAEEEVRLSFSVWDMFPID